LNYFLFFGSVKPFWGQTALFFPVTHTPRTFRLFRVAIAAPSFEPMNPKTGIVIRQIHRFVMLTSHIAQQYPIPTRQQNILGGDVSVTDGGIVEGLYGIK
jgi:hypothetical protein